MPVTTYNFKKSVTESNCEYIIDYCLSNYEMREARMGKNTENSIVYHKERKTQVAFIEGKSEKDKDIQDMMKNFILVANDKFFHYDIDFFETVQFAKYEGGGHYNWHQDYFQEMMNKETRKCRKLSVTLNLSPYNESGGHLELFDGPNVLSDELRILNNTIGTAVVFDSRDWHRVTPITSGVRYSLVCWSQGPHFK